MRGEREREEVAYKESPQGITAQHKKAEVKHLEARHWLLSCGRVGVIKGSHYMSCGQ